MRLREFLALLAASPCVAFAAATIPGDVTGVWLDERHPGWGLGIAQQNDTAFATLFVYDAAGAPTWYVASRMQANGVNFDPCGTMDIAGPLYRTQWPSFGGAGSPQGNLQVQPVGTMTFSVRTVQSASCDRNTASLNYTLDGTATSVQLTRQTWGSQLPKFLGQYLGGVVFSVPGAPCPDINAFPTLPASSRQLGFSVLQGASTGAVRIVWGTGTDTVCEIDGAYSQAGQLGAVTGTFVCAPINFGLPPGDPMRLSNIVVTDAGFVASLALDSGACHYTGALSGSRRP